jgi:outer membrane protein TolC
MLASRQYGLVFTIALLATGCVRSVYMPEADFQRERNVCLEAPLPPPGSASNAPDSHVEAGDVRTVRSPGGVTRPITLAECVALAAEQGRVGGDSLRVLIRDPAIAGAAIDGALSRFDAVFETNALFSRINEPVGTALQSVTTPSDVINSQNATVNASIAKPLPTGGVAALTFETDYTYSNQNNRVNPAYQPRLTFGFEQPLLRSAGEEINQILPGIPTATFLNLPSSGNGGSILLSRVAFDQSRHRLTGRVQDLLFNVETAYWALYLSYWNFYAQDQASSQGLEIWQKTKARFDEKLVPIQDLALAEEQYQSIRANRISALGAVLEAERNLRLTVGLPPEDGKRLIPADSPTRAPYVPDWSTALAEALANRPDLGEARDQVKAAQLQLKASKNLALPDLRVYATYDLNGLGSRLDGGSTTDNAFANAASNHYHDWNLGLRLDVPIGGRSAAADVRRSQLILEQRLEALKDLETRAAFSLQQSYRQLVQTADRIRIQTARRRAAETQYRARLEEYNAPGVRDANTNFLIQAQLIWIGSLRDEQSVIYDYNVALADFERQRGSLLRFDDVVLTEGALPSFAQDRASQHIRERALALKLRERAAPLPPSTDGPKPADPVAPPLEHWLEDLGLPAE